MTNLDAILNRPKSVCAIMTESAVTTNGVKSVCTLSEGSVDRADWMRLMNKRILINNTKKHTAEARTALKHIRIQDVRT